MRLTDRGECVRDFVVLLFCVLAGVALMWVLVQ